MCGEEKWKNFKGNEFVRSNYKIPNAKIGSLRFKEVKVTEEFSEEKDDCIFWSNPAQKKSQKSVGSLGRTIFKSTGLLFDISQSKMIVTRDLKKLKRNGYDLEKFLKVPLIINEKGIALKINSDIGELKLILDTGATLTVVSEKLYPLKLKNVIDHRGLPTFRLNEFSIGGRDFGPKDLFFLKITQELQEFDGALGMDFIKDHVFYIDFPNKTLCIE